MTGQPRTTFANFPHEVLHDEALSHMPGRPNKARWAGNGAIQHFWDKLAWAGVEYDKFNDSDPRSRWLVAHSIRNRVLRPLTASGGYDLFVIEPGRRVSTEWSVFEPTTVNEHGERDRMFVMPGGAEPDLWYDTRDDERWGCVLSDDHNSTSHIEELSSRATGKCVNASATERLGCLIWHLNKAKEEAERKCGFYHSCNNQLRGPLLAANPSIQGLLYQLKHLADCNEAVRKREAATGTRYTFKMRLRPDFGWDTDIPNLPSLVKDGNLSRSKIIVPSNRIFSTMGQHINDSFAVGLAEAMDVYFGRYQSIHTFPRAKMGPCTWMAETFVSSYLLEHSIELNSDVRFRTWAVRLANMCNDSRSEMGGAGRINVWCM